MKSNTSLLIIDDDADDRMLFINAVKEIAEDINCLAARDGQHALELLRNEKGPLPDLIFLDLRMPRFNGKKCLLEIKKDDRLKHIPIIIYTTSKEDQDSREMKDMGAVHFISKPNDPEEIYYLVSFALEEQWQLQRRNSQQ